MKALLSLDSMPTKQVSPPSSASLTLRKGQSRLFCSPASRNQKCHGTPPSIFCLRRVSARAAINQESTTDLGVDFGDLWKAYSGTASKVESQVNNATQAAKAAVSDSTEQAATNTWSVSQKPAEAAQASSSEIDEPEEEEYFYEDEEEDCSGEEYDTAQASGYGEDEGGEADAAPDGILQSDASGGEGVGSTGDAVSSATDGVADGAANAASDTVNHIGDGVGKEVERAGALSSGDGSLASKAAPKLSKPGAFDAGSSSSQQAANSLSQSADTGANAAGGVAENATSAADSAASKATEAFGVASPSDASPLDSFTASFSDLTQGLREKAGDAKASASQALSGLTGDLRDQVESFSSGVSKQVEGVSEGINKQLGGVTGLAGDALQDAASQLNSAKEAAAKAVAAVSEQFLDQTATAVSGLPPPVRDTVYAAAAVLSKALADPLVTQTAIGASITIPSLLWVTNRFGGYSGLLRPERTAVILEEENAVLLDIRSEEQRQAAGIADLRFEARSKGFALPQLEISKRSYSQLSKAEALELQLATTLIQGLYMVKPSTKMIVLDDSQPRAIKLARAIRSNIGLRAYVLEGGFKAWATAGLPVKEADDYEVTTLDTLNDTIERLREPVRAVITISLAFLSVAAAYDVHKTLQFVGTFGLIVTFGTAPYRFATVGEAAKTFLGPLAGLVGSALPEARPGSQPMAAQDDAGADDEEEAGDSRTKGTETDSSSFNTDAGNTGGESETAPVKVADEETSAVDAANSKT